jgi:hypothetical protein
MLTYSCDFETTTDPDDTRVWAWGAYEINSKEFEWGRNIESFFRFSRRKV